LQLSHQDFYTVDATRVMHWPTRCSRNINNTYGFLDRRFIYSIGSDSVPDSSSLINTFSPVLYVLEPKPSFINFWFPDFPSLLIYREGSTIIFNKRYVLCTVQEPGVSIFSCTRTLQSCWWF
jgi:hypothetical protein